MARRRVAVLISGSGSNLQALIDHAARPGSSVEVALAVSNEPAAYGLERARRADIAARVVDHRDFADRTAFEGAIDECLHASDIELVCLAGFMRILTPAFVLRWKDRLLNIHPSLLPAFRGLDTHARAVAAGVRVHGCTVHLVRPELDDGPILLQGVVPVLADDDPARLGARVLEAEHVCYPAALEGLASGTITVVGGHVTGTDRRLFLHPSLAGT